MGLACSRRAFADTADLVRANSSSRKKSANLSPSAPQKLERTPPPVPPRDKKPLFSRTSELKHRIVRQKSSSKGSGFNAADNIDAVVDEASVRDQGVVVLVRIRPTTQSEAGQRCFLQVQSPTQLHVPLSKSAPTEKTYTFDAVLPHTTTQEQVYLSCGPKLIQNLLNGFNATMIAYGQTGSGKTFTMEGSGQDPGVIPRFCRSLFEAIGELGSRRSVAVVASYVEIYNESIFDLLAETAPNSRLSPARKTSPRARQGSNSVSPVVSPGGGGNGGAFSKPTIRENKDGVYVENVTEQRVHNEVAVLALLARGSNARTKGETQMNVASSRSHAVLTLSISQSLLDDGVDSGGEEGVSASHLGTVRSKISLVDLAGSERAKSTGAAGLRLKEGAQINKSLSALGNVIKALTMGGNTHVPYRDSKLTRLLQDSLGGTAYTVVCCNVSPVEASESETLGTLHFAERLKKVKNKMVIHMDAKSKEILALKRENAELRARVEYLEGMMDRGGEGAGYGSRRGTGVVDGAALSRRAEPSSSGSHKRTSTGNGAGNDLTTEPNASSSSSSKANGLRMAAGTSPGPRSPPPVPPRPASPPPR